MTMTDTHAKQSIGDTAVGVDPTTQTLEYGDWKVRVADLPPNAIAYLLQNGFSQSMTDAAALTKAQKQDKDGNPLSEDEIEAKVRELRDNRFKKILEGSVGVRVGTPRATGVEAIVRQIATERMRAKLAKHKLVLPSGKNKETGEPNTLKVGDKLMTRDDLINAEIAKYGDEIRAEANRRNAANEAEAEGAESLDDILG